MKPSTIQAMMTSPLFKGFSAEEMNKNFDLSSLAVKNYHKGEKIFTERDFSRSLGIILKGTVRVEKTADKHSEKSIIMSTLEQGGTFGMAAIFYDDGCYPTEITAIKSTTVVFLTQEWLMEGFKKEPRLVQNYIYLLSAKIHFLNRKIETFSTRGGIGKLYGYLLEEYAKHGQNKQVKIRYTMGELASVLGVGRTTLYRELEALTDDGFIIKDGKTFTLPKEES